ncbi:MAG: DUF6600 domain-containing protein [Thermoanaerobaculia bacterium]
MLVRRCLASVPLLLLLLLALAAPAAASWEDELQDDGIRQSVARLAWHEGDVSIARGDAPGEWQRGAVNFPLTTGDRIRVGSGGRTELQLGGAILFLAPGTELAFSNLGRDARLLALTSGTVTVRVFDVRAAQQLELATPNASVALELPGAYRIDVNGSGDTAISVARGRARAATAEGGVRLGWGERMHVFGLARPVYDVVDLGHGDAWDRWVNGRSRRLRDVRSAARVHADVYGIDDLDEWGEWKSTSDWGWVWFPRVNGPDWAPYRSGRWIWRDPWGWTWLSDEPWGWGPYHHGRWLRVRNRWAWLPVGPKANRPTWCPAIVGFVGGGPGWDGSPEPHGYVGWFPLGPREPLRPWWTRSTGPTSDLTHRYLHRDRAVYLSRAVFAGGHDGERDLLHAPDLLRDLRNAPLLAGPLPVLPERIANGAPRGSAGTPGRPAATGSAARPPLPVRRSTSPPRTVAAAPTPAPTPARAASPPPARRPRPLPRTSDAPAAAAPPWPDEGKRLEPRPRTGPATPVEPRGTTSNAPPWEAPTPTPQAQPRRK